MQTNLYASRRLRNAVRFAIGLTAAFLSHPAFADGCTPSYLARLDVSLTKGGGLVVPVEVSGKDARMLVHTGASFSALAESFLEGLDGERHQIKMGFPQRFVDGQGEELRDFVQLHDLVIGKWRTRPATNVDFLVVTDDWLSERETYDGILALNILKGQFDIEIDFVGGKVTFYRPNQCAKSNPVYWARDWHEVPLLKKKNLAIVRLRLDGHELTAELDTGASYSALDEAVASKIFGLRGTASSEEATVETGRADKGAWHVFDVLELPGLKMEKPKIFVSQSDPPESDMVLGRDVLRNLRLYFAFRRDLLFVTSASKAPATTE